MGWESSGVVRFDLGPLLQDGRHGRLFVSHVKCLNFPIIGPRVLGW